MIEVTLLNFVAATNPGHPPQFKRSARPGLTVMDLIEEEGLEDESIQLVIVNGRVGRRDSQLTDGDRVALSALITGG